MIIKKTPEQIQKMRKAGKALAEVMAGVGQEVVPGITTKKLDEIAYRMIRERGGVPSFLGYRGSHQSQSEFPGSICASVNDVIVHGIPDETPLEEGDIVSVDMGLILEGWHADRAYTFAVGEIASEAARLLEVTERALHAGIEKFALGGRLTDVSHSIESVVEEAGFSIVREYAGHQIGRAMHEGDIQLLNYGPPGRGPALEPGIVFAIEPMVNAGGWQTKTLDDGWTVVTADGSLSAHFEHTVAVTQEGPVILTAEAG